MGGGGLVKINILASHIHVYVTGFEKKDHFAQKYSISDIYQKLSFSVWNEALTSTA